jgi:hypothetical protein
MKLELNWSSRTADNVFTAIDQAFNNFSRKLYIIPEQIDMAVQFGSLSNFYFTLTFYRNY